MERSAEDEIPWIAYADFFCALALVLFVLAAAVIVRAGRGAAFVNIDVEDAATKRSIADCITSVKLGDETRIARSDPEGRAVFRIASIDIRDTVQLDASCVGYRPGRVSSQIHAGDTAHVRLTMGTTGPLMDTTMSIRRIEGDDNFELNDYHLTATGVDRIRRIGSEYKQRLKEGEVIIVEGHTDDSPFRGEGDRDNWVLSGERAAAAARVLTVAVYGIAIPECRVVIMGFGASRPRRRVTATDAPIVKAEKRKANRRIEFRILRNPSQQYESCSMP